MDFLVRSFQAAIFGTIDIRDPLEVGHHVRSATGDLLSGEPLVLPLPSDAPLEIPRIVLKSKDERYSCNVSGARIDFFYRDKDPSRKWVDLRDEYLQYLVATSHTLVETLKATVTRLGSVAEFEVPIDISPSLTIRRAYLKEGIIPGEHAIELGVLHRQSWETLEINRWIRLRGKEAESRLRVVVDINTIPEKKYDFDVDGIESFYYRASNFFIADLEKIVLQRSGLET